MSDERQTKQSGSTFALMNAPMAFVGGGAADKERLADNRAKLARVAVWGWWLT